MQLPASSSQLDHDIDLLHLHADAPCVVVLRGGARTTARQHRSVKCIEISGSLFEGKNLALHHCKAASASVNCVGGFKCTCGAGGDDEAAPMPLQRSISGRDVCQGEVWGG